MSKQRRGTNFEEHFKALSKRLVDGGAITQEEIEKILLEAQRDRTARDIYETANAKLIRIGNAVLRTRGKKYK